MRDTVFHEQSGVQARSRVSWRLSAAGQAQRGGAQGKVRTHIQ